MIRVLEFFGQDVTKSPEVLARCFADTTADVVKDAEVIGLPTGCYLGAGSEVTTANGTKARLKSDGNWVWLAKADLITRTITENGTYEAADDNADGYVEVTVNVPDPTLVEKSVTANGEYEAVDDEAYGYSKVTVNVPATTYDVQGTFPINEGEVYSEMMANQSTNITEYAPFNMVINFPEEGSTIANGTCHGWRGLHTVHIPNHYTDMGQGTFSECHDLANANIPTSVTELKEDVFFYSGITSIDIPAGVTTIGPYAFAQCDYLKSVICRATTPPTIADSSFNEIPSDCIFYVPAASVDAYKAATNWSELYQEILPIPTT